MNGVPAVDIPAALLCGLAGQAALLIWHASAMSSKVRELSSAVIELTRRVSGHDTDVGKALERMARIEALLEVLVNRRRGREADSDKD